MRQDAKCWAGERTQSRKSVVCLYARGANCGLCLTHSKGINHDQRGSCSQLLCTHSPSLILSVALVSELLSHVCSASQLHTASWSDSKQAWRPVGPPLADVRCLFLSLSRVPSSETDLSVHTDLACLQVSSFQSWCTSSHIVWSPNGTWLPEVQWEPSGSSLNVTARVLSSTYVIQENMEETPLRLNLRITLESFSAADVKPQETPSDKCVQWSGGNHVAKESDWV